MTHFSNNKRDSFLRLPRRELLAAMPRWLRERLDLHHTRIDELVRRAAQDAAPGERILDAGAGEGRYKAHFAQLNYAGIDLAVGDTAWNYSGLDVVGDLGQLPFRGARSIWRSVWKCWSTFPSPNRR